MTNLRLKKGRKFVLFLALFIFAGLVTSCDSGTSTPNVTGDAVPTSTETLETAGTPAATAATESNNETAPAPEPSAEGDGDIAPDSVKEVATAVAERTPVPTPTPDRIEQEVVAITTSLGLEGKTFLGLVVEDWLNLAFSALVVLLGYFLATRLLTLLIRWIAKRTSTDFDDSVLVAVAPDLRWLVFLFFARFALLRLDFLSEGIRKALEDIFFVLGLVIITAISVRLINQVAIWYKSSLPSEDEHLRLNPVIMAVQRSAILFLLVLMLSIGLAHFGINLGVLSITILVMAVILSLGAKDAISDAISGFIILLDQPFRVHDGIQIKEFDTWGDVIQIGTRTTRVLTRDNREVIIPNTRMLNSVVVNYTYPDPEYRMQVDLNISYDTDLDQVSHVIEDALKEVDVVVQSKDVEILLIDFGDTARKIRVRWWVDDYHQPWIKKNKVSRAIDSALDQAGIEIPITTYDLNIRKEQSHIAPLENNNLEK
jgi:small-conductance mechanosensitive channel